MSRTVVMAKQVNMFCVQPSPTPGIMAVYLGLMGIGDFCCTDQPAMSPLMPQGGTNWL